MGNLNYLVVTYFSLSENVFHLAQNNLSSSQLVLGVQLNVPELSSMSPGILCYTFLKGGNNYDLERKQMD